MEGLLVGCVHIDPSLDSVRKSKGDLQVLKAAAVVELQEHPRAAARLSSGLHPAADTQRPTSLQPRH